MLPFRAILAADLGSPWLLGEGRPGHRRAVSSIPGLHPAGTNSIFPKTVTTQNGHSQTSPGRGEPPLTETHGPRRTSAEKPQGPPCWPAPASSSGRGPGSPRTQHRRLPCLGPGLGSIRRTPQCAPRNPTSISTGTSSHDAVGLSAALSSLEKGKDLGWKWGTRS